MKYATFCSISEPLVHAAVLPLEDTFEPLTPPRIRAICDGKLRLGACVDMRGVDKMPEVAWRLKGVPMPNCKRCAALMTG